MGSQIILFIIVAAALGFGAGWMMRNQQAAGPAARSRVPAPGAGSDEERERLRAELAAARDEHTRLESAVAEARSLADTRAGRVRELEAKLEDRGRQPDAGDGDAGAAEEEGTPPEAIAPPEATDDLKQISGVGPQIEKTLNELGIYRFQQIAAFTPENVAWVNRRLRFKGRIEREDWIGQAKKLATGAQAE